MSDDTAISRFAYEVRPTRVLFAPGAVRELTFELDALGFRRALVVSSPGRLAKLPPLDELLGESLVGVLDVAVEHVPTGVVATALAEVRRRNPDVCVSVGGGSPIGLGKAIARETGLPLVAVPTTYSGSEMTSIWGVTDHNGKRTGRDPRVAPRAVVYDPDLTLSLSPEMSAASGMNAMAHAVEALYAARASPIASDDSSASRRSRAEYTADMSGNRAPNRSSLAPTSGFCPVRLIWSSITISAPWANPVFTPPAALVRIRVLTPSTPSTRTANVTVRAS